MYFRRDSQLCPGFLLTSNINYAIQSDYLHHQKNIAYLIYGYVVNTIMSHNALIIDTQSQINNTY